MGKRPNCGVGSHGGGTLYSVVTSRPRTAAPATAAQPYPPAAAASPGAAATASTASVTGASVSAAAPPNPAVVVRRGSLAEALRAAETEESRQLALDNLERDRFAESTWRSRDSCLRPG